MLGQIRRHIAKKNEKLFYIFVLFIVAFGISIVHYMFLEKDAVLSLKQDDVSSTYYAKYHYLSKNVNNITFYFQYEKDGEIIFQQDLKNMVLWVKHNTIWKIFEEFYGLQYSETQLFIKNMVEEHLNWKGFTPLWVDLPV